MAIVVVLEVPGMTQAQYERGVEQVTGRAGPVKRLDDGPVDGLVSYAAGSTRDGRLVVDVRESEEAFQRFGEKIRPILREIGPPELRRRSTRHSMW